MTDPETPKLGHCTPNGPDGDLDRENTWLSHGARLTGVVAGLIVEQIRQAAGRLPGPDLSGAQQPELMQLPELLGELVADLRELRPSGTVTR